MIAALVVGVGAAAGFAVGRATGEGTTLTTTTTATTVVQSTTLPPAVDRTRRRLLAAARARDWDALRRIIDGRPIRYTFGPDDPAGPIAFWQRVGRQGGKPIQTLAEILRLPYVLDHGTYWWPFAYQTPPGELTPYEIRLLSGYATEADVAKWKSFGGYFGYRAAIDATGHWVAYVSGD